ncbi:MAG: hypothetical protein ACKO6K_11720, partial [Chitinophagaceae bacterium]
MMDKTFEVQKNWKASLYTGLVVSLLLLLFFWWTWPLQSWYPPVPEEGIEVNLGNSDEGLGDQQPFVPTSSLSVAQQNEQAVRQVAQETTPSKDFFNDNNDPDAPEIKKPISTKTVTPQVSEKELNKKQKPTPAVKENVPAPPQPKAVFKGVSGTGKGGNEADQYQKGGQEGIAGGRGDQGQPGGDPDSKNYSGGGTGQSGISISRGLQGRRITQNPSFEDEFNENAKVAVDVRVNEQGAVIEATYQPRGSTTSNSNYKAIALRKARLIKFNSGEQESSGTLI